MTEIVLGPASPTAELVSLPGLEAIHTWDGAVALNDRSAWPRYKVDRMLGLWSKGDLEAIPDNPVGRIGEIPRRAYKRGKTVTYEGLTQARSLPDLRAAEMALRAAFAPDDERTMVVAENPAYGTNGYRFDARCILFEGAEEQTAPPTRTSFGYERPFAIAVRMSDPRFFALDEVVETVTGATAGLTELAFDVVGTAPTEPRITLLADGANDLADPILTHVELGLDLQIIRPLVTSLDPVVTLGLVITDGGVEAVAVDFARRSVEVTAADPVFTFPGGLPFDARSALDLRASSWWDAGRPGLVPGTNTIEITSGADTPLNTGVEVEVRYRPAYW